MTESHQQSWLSYLTHGHWGSRDERVAVPVRSPPVPSGLGLHNICDSIEALVEYDLHFLFTAQCLMMLMSIGQHRLRTWIDGQLENVVRAA